MANPNASKAAQTHETMKMVKMKRVYVSMDDAEARPTYLLPANQSHKYMRGSFQSVLNDGTDIESCGCSHLPRITTTCEMTPPTKPGYSETWPTIVRAPRASVPLLPFMRLVRIGFRNSPTLAK